MTDFRERTCGECIFFKNNMCRIGPPTSVIDGRFSYIPRNPDDDACGSFVEDKKQVLLED